MYSTRTVLNTMDVKETLQNNVPVVPISIHEVPARFTPRITVVNGLGLFLRSTRCLLRQCTASAALKGKVPRSFLAPLPADCEKGPFTTVVSPAGVSGVPAHGRLHTVNVCNRISLPRRKLTLLAPKCDPVAMKTAS